MIRIKIISNPYKKVINYQRWVAEQEEWVNINLENHRSSKLLSADLVSGFFPFKAKQIVSQIVKEYYVEGEPIELMFEGSADEYYELEAVCSTNEFGTDIRVTLSEKYLENARDILPEVKNLFKEMNPLIMQSVDQESIEKDLMRFADASSDVVPICVIGNYSSGKSTFINALIGCEILPNGSNPVTAKIYKIARSKFLDRASIKLNYLNQEIKLMLTEQNSYFEGTFLENDLTDLLKENIFTMTNESLVLRMNKAINIINDFKDDEENNGVSDLIEIEMPFVNGVLAKSQHPFVIFDTPGSNSASNAKHLQVLKKAMANMTNGLPIFVATPESLDSTDNDNLNRIIRDLDELDSRFTMIIVNKADKNDLNRKESSEAEEKLIMRQAIPRNLYSGGIFYVSSIIGLGSKNGGLFLDDFYDETYEDQERKYKDPENRRYKQLYVYDIMPSQIKSRVDKLAREQENLIYANSGLFSIETEIETFAGKYAAYNKCFQSQMFLSRVIELTQNAIDYSKKRASENRQMFKDILEKDKRALLEQMESEAEREKVEFREKYNDLMNQYVEGVDKTFATESLKKQETLLTNQFETEKNYDSQYKKVKESQDAIRQNLIHSVGNVFKERKLESVGDIFSNFQSDLTTISEERKNKNELRKNIDKLVSNKILENVKKKYNEQLEEIGNAAEKESQNYWTMNTEKVRDSLAKIVTGSDVLTDSRRGELERIIIEYQKLSFDDSLAEKIFKKEDFEKRFVLANHVIWQSDHLNLDKIAKTYNESILENITRKCMAIEESHCNSAYLWIENLLDEIRKNIVEYSPELSKKAKEIQKLTKDIENATKRQESLKNYTLKLDEMMDWKSK